ncbi:glucose-1-phosphate adenylyltransferase [Ningiella sp. W23]|uniref:glucose-1-phosphate adenylyltransferase n=1 Tax=Ningiella sp. W23 TaxID=3023715 RepID=UPI0037565CB7
MIAMHESQTDQLLSSTLVLILAGGQGSRLHELTKTRAKPCMEFAANYRLIDFPLSNCINSGLKKVGIVTQYKAQTLLNHLVGQSCKFNHHCGEFLELLPASQQESKNWYQGTADALHQNIAFIESVKPQRVLVLSGDHIYKMDYRLLLSEHANSRADMTVSCIESSIEDARGKLGVMQVDGKMQITAFEEKPEHPSPLADKPGHVLASMGNYVFETDFLLQVLREDAANHDSTHDFGKDVIPSLIKRSKVNGFRFRDSNNTIPYWKDVGTLDNYYGANMDMLKASAPLDVNDPLWPISSAPSSLPPTRCYTLANASAALSDSLLGHGCELHACEISGSVVCEKVHIEKDVSIKDAVILPNVRIGKGAKVFNAIVDAACDIPPGVTIGFNARVDRQNGFRVTEKGVTLVSQEALDKLRQRALSRSKRAAFTELAHSHATQQVKIVNSTQHEPERYAL